MSRMAGPVLHQSLQRQHYRRARLSNSVRLEIEATLACLYRPTGAT